MRSAPACVVVVVGALLVAACTAKDGATATSPAAAVTTVAPTAATPPTTAGPFALGIEYTERGLAQPFGDAGITWAKTRLEAFAWGAIEPKPPSGATHTTEIVTSAVDAPNGIVPLTLTSRPVIVDASA